MSHHGAIVSGLMKLLADQGFGVYREDGAYAADERGIVTSLFPSTPREVISVTIYDMTSTRFSAAAARRLSSVDVQIKYRLADRDPLAGVAFFDQLGGALDGKRLDLGPIQATGEFISFANLGKDNSHAWVFSTNWRIHSLQAIQTPGPRGTADALGIESPTTGQTVQEGQNP